MQRFLSIAAALGLGLCALAIAGTTGCAEGRGRRVEVIRERPEREDRHEREGNVEHERRGDERDRDRERDREHH